MMAALDMRGGVLGYFIEAQVGNDPAAALSVIQQKYGVSDAVDVVLIDEEFHELAMRGQESGQQAYVENDMAQLRPLINATIPSDPIQGDGSVAHNTSGLPENASVTVDGVDAGTVSGGVFSLVADTPGAYTVIVEKWPYMPLIYVVEAI